MLSLVAVSCVNISTDRQDIKRLFLVIPFSCLNMKLGIIIAMKWLVFVSSYLIMHNFKMRMFILLMESTFGKK